MNFFDDLLYNEKAVLHKITLFIFQEHTAGINCETCQEGYFRPNGVLPDALEPCVPCDCNVYGSTGYCTPDDSFTHMGKVSFYSFQSESVNFTLIFSEYIYIFIINLYTASPLVGCRIEIHKLFYRLRKLFNFLWQDNLFWDLKSWTKRITLQDSYLTGLSVELLKFFMQL